MFKYWIFCEEGGYEQPEFVDVVTDRKEALAIKRTVWDSFIQVGMKDECRTLERRWWDTRFSTDHLFKSRCPEPDTDDLPF